MKASEHTAAMLIGWQAARVERADLAVRRPCGAMLWQRELPLDELPLPWARAENAHGAEIYIRPARGFDWPMVFLDDVTTGIAQEMARKHGGVAVQTSPAGGCHLWLPCVRALDETARNKAQRWLAEKFGADRGSVSGEHLGRLAGLKNWKRGGCWVNVLASPADVHNLGPCIELPPEIWDTVADRPCPSARTQRNPIGAPTHRTDRPPGSAHGDASPSGQEWGWVCRMLEAGQDPERVYLELVGRAWNRRGPDTERYARRTVAKAMEKLEGSRR